MKPVGAEYLGNNHCLFRVWAPEKKHVTLHLLEPHARKIAMQPEEWGYFSIKAENVAPGTLYFYNPDGEGTFPDPASYAQPQGVHGPSAVVDHTSFTWTDENWKNLPLQELVLYELHVGTFTPEGTFEAIIPRLDSLKEVGINALELMPVAQFPGERNWGYDGVFPYAVQHSYGGPDGLKKLVDACHAREIAVLLDVVYNHLGPEGNYLDKYGPYFTDKYKTPWGKAINYDAAYADGVRAYIADNPVYWLRHFHLDGLRLDAIHTIFDQSATSIWELLRGQVDAECEKAQRPFYLIAESDLNSPRVVQAAETGGFGFDMQWLDDFHHALYVLLDKEGRKFYEDFGQMEQLAKAYTDGFVHSGQYVKFRKKTFGASSAHVPGQRFIAFAQNHDQVGNRVKGERLSMLVNFERLKLAAAALLLAPYVPMLFMGEEYGEETPFLYFVSHSDKELIHAVQEGRKKEFADFKWEGEPPNPQDKQTFVDSKLQWQKRDTGKHRKLLRWHQVLLNLRQTMPALKNFDKKGVAVKPLGQEGFILTRQAENQKVLCLFNLSEQKLTYRLPASKSTYKLVLHSKSEEWVEEAGTALDRDEHLAGGALITLLPLSLLILES